MSTLAIHKKLFLSYYNSMKKEKGFSLFLSILLMSVILSVVLGLSVIMMNQNRMIGFMDDSVKVFYVAETGAEKALFEIFKGEDINYKYEKILSDGSQYSVKTYCCQGEECIFKEEGCPLCPIEENGIKMIDLDCDAKAFCIYSTGIIGEHRKTFKIEIDQWKYDCTAENNRKDAIFYCSENPGTSTIQGDMVYCDFNDNMWSVTLNTELGGDKLKVNPNVGDDQFLWAQEGMTEEERNIVPRYGTNDCNRIPSEYLHMFPACNACNTLSYAGFSGGWRLPSQEGRDGFYCALNRQLWDFGEENCQWDPLLCGSAQETCIPSWDETGVINYYWSSTQFDTDKAWRVSFGNGFIDAENKINSPSRVRCFLGEY